MKKNKYFNLFKKFKEKKILVLGDFILDEYIYGETERISREAPVLILKYANTVYLAGGGANPVMNIKALGASPLPVSIIGNDSYSNIILKILQDKGIDISFIIRDDNYVLPVKTRIMAGSVHTVKQQIVRIDKYHEMKITKEEEDKLINIIESVKDNVDAILVSDYDGGIITKRVINFINNIARQGKKVVVDSRYSLKYFRNIITATPNETEAGPIVGIERYEEKDIEIIIKKLKTILKSKGMIITRGSKGMVVFENNRIYKIPAFGSDEIVDVSGAGDTVASIITLALSCGLSVKDAAYLANIGGGIVVMKRGVATVTQEELKRALKNVKD
ncbi:MAG: bifunctional ADP-heptose synthase [Candidatus Goldbacteria bacterium]|nr:bifunctional ADP-heptose synthase [Candidatus Goldiibacteriota bacterium]